MIAPHALDAFEAFTRHYKDARILLELEPCVARDAQGLAPQL